MDLLVALRTGDPNIFLGTFLGHLERDPRWALCVIGELRAPDNLIIRNSKIISRFLLFVASCLKPEEYKEYIKEYFRKACWSDALYIYRFRILFNKEENDKHYELELMAEYLLKGDILAAKWAPSEKSVWNDEPLFAGNLLMKMTNKSPKEYRQMLSSLRVNILETQMSEHRFDEIRIEDIPLTALRKKHSAFGSHGDMELRNKYLSSIAMQSKITLFSPLSLIDTYEGICVLDNYIECPDAYNFISWVSKYSRGYWQRKIINMGEFPGICKIPENILETENGLQKYVDDKLFGGGVFVLDKVYELVLGQCLLWKVEVPKIIYVFTNTALRKISDLEPTEQLYKMHKKKMPMILYVNVGNKMIETVSSPHICQVCGVDQITLGITMERLGSVEPIGPRRPIDLEDYIKIFYW